MENKQKSQRGNAFSDEVLKFLKQMKHEILIDNFELKKFIPFYKGYKPQFYAPFIVTKNKNKVLIFTMTTMRSDRNKEKQWDAFGIKHYLGKDVKAFVILPDILSAKEKVYIVNEKQKIKQNGYMSYIDDICQLSELKSLIENI